MKRHRIGFTWATTPEAETALNDKIDMCFAKSRANDRKAWLEAFE
jgi:hypothetical protein